jgi:phospholipid/cholesterol/gamma-HCH transport system permease protein
MSAERISCPEKFDHDTGSELYRKIRSMKPGKKDRVVLDLSGTESMDSMGGAWLIEIRNLLRKHGAELDWENESEDVARFLAILKPAIDLPPDAGKAPETGIFEELGGKTLGYMGELRQFGDLCVDAIYWTIIAPFEGRGFRWELLIEEMHEMGVRAVRIVCMMNFLLGLIIAMLSAAQVEAFGLTIYVADLIMIGFARELAAIMTAVVVSARTGAAIAAEISTMKVQEEIDALRGMGLNVAQFLVAPKLLALLIVLPCLVVLGLVSGILGGSCWGIFVLGFEPSVWFRETRMAADLGDLGQGFLKTFFFAIAIVLIGCHNGLRVEGGSRGVGLMTTRSVVMDIFMLICIDIIFALIFYYVLK